jgi:hypothetical protein
LFLAYEYEKLQSKGEFLEEFFSGSAHNIKTDIVRQWLNQLIECRSSGKQFQLPSDSNLNTMLKHILYDEQGAYVYSKLICNRLFYLNRNIFIQSSIIRSSFQIESTYIQ